MRGSELVIIIYIYIYIYIERERERERERDTREPPGLPFIGLWLSWPLIGEGRWVSIRNQVQFILTYSTEGHSTNMLNLSKGRHYWPRILVCSCLMGWPMGWVTLGNHLIETNHFFFFQICFQFLLVLMLGHMWFTC